MTTLTAKRIRENNSAVQAARPKPAYASSNPSHALDRDSDMSFRDQRIRMDSWSEKFLCEYPECHRYKQYYIGWEEPDGKTQWRVVCSTHDTQIGRYNLTQLYPFLNKRQIVHLDVTLNAVSRDDLNDKEVRERLTTEGFGGCLTDGP
jgi:hypothetical protein